MFVRPLFEDDLLVAEADPASYEPTIHAEEAAQVERAVEKRRREFTAARGLARTLLFRLGLGTGPLLNGPDRAPIFPDGAVGSITHTAGYCGVVVGRATDYLGLGLDVEQAEPLKPELLRMILAEDERAAYDPADPASLERAKLVFSAKEAAYKAQYALTRNFLGFSAMRVEVDDAAGRFRAIFREPSGRVFVPGDVLEGSFRRSSGLVASAVAIRVGGPYDRR